MLHYGGDDGTRTRDIRLAKAALSQLSYIPMAYNSAMQVGLTGFEPVTPVLSGLCSKPTELQAHSEASTSEE
jgi:hypothetical protein